MRRHSSLTLSLQRRTAAARIRRDEIQDIPEAELRCQQRARRRKRHITARERVAEEEAKSLRSQQRHEVAKVSHN